MATSAERAAAVDRVAKAVAGFEPETQTIALQGLTGALDPGALAAAIESTANTVKDRPPSVQRAALVAAGGAGTPDTATTNDLWRYIVIGLLVLLFVALVGLITLLALGKTVDVVLTAFTALLTGTVGLFVPSPAGSNSAGK
jgi:hypothetical protein